MMGLLDKRPPKKHSPLRFPSSLLHTSLPRLYTLSLGRSSGKDSRPAWEVAYKNEAVSLNYQFDSNQNGPPDKCLAGRVLSAGKICPGQTTVLINVPIISSAVRMVATLALQAWEVLIMSTNWRATSVLLDSTQPECCSYWRPTMG